MATTKAFELAQLSALTEVDGSGATIPVNFISSGLDLTNSIAPYITFTEGSNQTFLGIDGGRFWIRQSGIGGGDEFSINTDGTSEFNHAVTIADTTTSTSSATGSLIVSGGAGIAENLNVGGDLTVTGDFTVDGTTVALNTTDLNVEDKNITLNYHATADTSASADGAGITIQDAVDASNDASIIWDQSDSEFDVSHSMKIAGSVGVNNIVTNKVVKFNGTILDDSNIIDTGTKITLGSDTWATGAVVSTSGITSPGSPGTYVYNASAFDYAVGGMRAWSWGSSSARGTYSFIQLKEDGDNQQTALFIDTVGRVGINSTNPTYGLQINNAKTTNDGTLYVNAQLNGSGDGVVINSNTRTTNDNADLLLKVIDRGNNVALSTTVSGRVGVGTDDPVTALHVDPGYVTLGTSTGTDNSWINNVEDGNLELVNEGRSTNDGAVRINRKNNPAGDTTYFRDTVIYDGKSNVVLFVDGSEGKVGIGTDSPNKELHLLSSTINKPMIKIESTGTNSYPGFQIVNDSQTWEVSTHGGHSDALTFYNGSAHTFALATGGNVGIGTNDPTAMLEINKTRAGLISSGSGDKGATLKLHTEAQWEGGYGNAPTNPDFLGSIDFSTGDSSTGEGVKASIRTTVESYYNTNHLNFYTSDGSGSTSMVERMSLQQNGRIVINRGTTDYEPSTGVIKNPFTVHTDYNTQGTQHVSISNLDGNWLDGTSGGDSQYGMVFGYNNQTRGGLIYDHRSTEMMTMWSSYAPIRFMVPDNADGNGVPLDSNINTALTLEKGGKVGVHTEAPKANFHVDTGGSSDGFAVGGKNISLNTTFQTGAQLEITLGDHQGCYVKVFLTGDWSGHSAMAFLGEYFIQNGATGYQEPGMIIREVDNTGGPAADYVSSQIYDGGNYDSFQIQFKLNTSSGVTTSNGMITYQVMGQFDAIT